ncbi:Asp-tRNA(Asn)/Glu-tRNA(Gln) amidotransferase subunit GatA [Bacteroidia bacterium]|nr:Asp-tRNA(Asn)/Glu-tRNA(Gln) amidotransferase subunit GatA [Bacteroidia bacterium]MDB9882643.1 Asp-tRNA(Asn)/Glu-tRNA(Gln) amidotransferase subunit GatA [Bacteroidia bacterium]MDC1395504.1 Asp-tRNA(Asn)/Glu-tRNA(Gln) amidotransferase subunit GatA [Bacteroidia bacterium]
MVSKKYTSLSQIQLDIDAGKTSCADLATYYLKQNEDKKHLNAVLEVFEDETIAKAKLVDQKIKEGTAGKLAGMFLAIKDNICYTGHRVSGSSKIIENYEAVYTATALQRLLDEDVIVIGRCNCDEFAMGASNENSAYGFVHNAADETKVPGGSSGGSAVAVQAELCLAALGSDTGGSVRQPASFTGTVGLKPTYGRISRNGLLSYASSFDQIGPITSCTEDAALLLEIMAGKDDADATSSNEEVKSFSPNPKKKYKIAYSKEAFESEGLASDVKAAYENLIETLKADGHSVEECSFPYLDYMVPCYYVLTTAEASSNLSRYSGMLYGTRSDKAYDIESTFKKSRSEGFGEEVKRRIMTGTFVLSADSYEAYYSKAMKVRRVIQNESNKILESFDFFLCPTTPTTAFEIGGNESKDPIKMYLADIFTVQAPLAGLPAVSVPTEESNGLSIGMQFMGKAFEEIELLNISKIVEGYYAS